MEIESSPKLTKPVVVPMTLDNNIYKKVKTIEKMDINPKEIEDEINEENDNDEIVDDVQEIIEKTTKKRGRPRTNIIEEDPIKQTTKKRGRPKKISVKEEPIYSSLDDFDEEEQSNIEVEMKDEEEISLPGLTDLYEEDDLNIHRNEDIEIEEESAYLDNFQDDNEETTFLEKYDNLFDDEKFASLLTGNKKIVSFVGTSKNGTSFIINNLAVILSSMGIDTAILDTTTNKNAYYIYTNNEESLRQIAVGCFENLKNGIAKGIKVNNKLTVYTTIPLKKEKINDSRPILETLISNHSLVLIDADFNTPIEYFEKSQEIYLVQSMDILTIQPLTEFLRDLKNKKALDERKLRVVLNKMLRLKGLSGKSIIGGMSNYNDPEMSFMTELFDRNTIRVSAQIPFDEDVYIKYLEGLMDCKVSINGYPKEFRQYLTRLAENVYPLLPESNPKQNKKNANNYSGSFSQGMNNTLENMRKKY